MHRHTAVLLFIAANVLVPSLRAQTPEERTKLASIRTAMEAFSDTTYLINYERTRIAVARTDRDNPFIHMELGYVAFRLGEITGTKKRYEDAASEFQWTADLRASWPYAWYYLGMAELSTGEAGVILIENLRQLFGQDALSRAVRSFSHAVEVDPTFSAALVDLANAAMRQRIAPRLLVAQAALRSAAHTVAGHVPEVQLVRGRIERRLLANDSAIAAFHAYLASGGDSAIGGVELARSFAQQAMPESTLTSYFLGVERPVSATARQEIRKDLRWFASPAELEAFDRAPADSVGPWLRRFWYGRDLNDGRHLGDRLTEQFRRYQFAVVNFGLPSKHRGFDVSFAFRDTSQQEFDDRGVIYLRHGPPNDRSTFHGNGTEPNESWVYRHDPPDGDMIVHFMALNDVQDFRLVQSLRDVCARRFSSDPLAPMIAGPLNRRSSVVVTTARVSDTVDTWRECVQSRARLSPEYERLARLNTNASDNAWASERLASMNMVHEAVNTDSYHLVFETELRPVVSLFAIGDASLKPELHLVFAVPVSRLHPQDGDNGTSTYPLSLRMLVFDSSSRMVAALDTLRVFRSANRLQGVYLTEQLVMRVPAGHYRYSFVIEEPHVSAGDAVSNRSLDIPRLDSAFSVSDVVMGREGSGLVWRRPDGEVPLNPLMRFPRDGDATLFYELYGLPQGAQVITRVRIVRSGGRSLVHRLFGGGHNSDLSYTTVTDAPNRSRVRQTLGLRSLAPGRYTLQVELTDPVSGQKVLRESPFEIEAARSS